MNQPHLNALYAMEPHGILETRFAAVARWQKQPGCLRTLSLLQTISRER